VDVEVEPLASVYMNTARRTNEGRTAPSSLCHASTEPACAIQHATDRSGICSVRAGALPEAEWPRGIRRQQSQRERAGDDEQRSEDSRALRHEADERRAG
jgi:hypothetical protein